MLVGFCSCGHHSTIHLPSDLGEYTFNKCGRLDENKIDYEKPKVIQFHSINMLKDDLRHTPYHKINEIVDENPGWEFIYYCKCSLSDTIELINVLQENDFPLPVIVDTSGVFLKENNLANKWTELGFICNQNNKCYGGGIVGSSLSSFDYQFEEAKAIMRYKSVRNIKKIQKQP